MEKNVSQIWKAKASRYEIMPKSEIKVCFCVTHISIYAGEKKTPPWLPLYPQCHHWLTVHFQPIMLLPSLSCTTKTGLIRLHAVDGYASDNPHSYSPLDLRPTFDLWPWANLAQNLISSSTPGGAPLYQVWWKSTEGFLRVCVKDVKIAYSDQVHWPLTLGGSRPKSNQFTYSGNPCT